MGTDFSSVEAGAAPPVEATVAAPPPLDLEIGMVEVPSGPSSPPEPGAVEGMRPTPEEVVAVPAVDDWPIRWEFPWVTFLVTIVCVLIWLGLQNESSPESDAALMKWGWRDAGAIWDGAWWSLIAACFVHGAADHLAGNLCVFWIFGWRLEQVLGHGRWLAFLLLSCFVSAALDQAWSGTHSYGASGMAAAVFGLFLTTRWRVRFLPLWIFVPVVLWNLWTGLVEDQLDLWTEFQSGIAPGDVAYPAHLAGFFFGALVGLVSFHRWKRWVPGAVITAAVVSSAIPLIFAPKSYQWLLHQAERAESEQDTEQALAWLDRAERRRPDLPDAPSVRANLYLAAARFDDALAEADRAVALAKEYSRKAADAAASRFGSESTSSEDGAAGPSEGVGTASVGEKPEKAELAAELPRVDAHITSYVRRIRGTVLLFVSRHDEAEGDFSEAIQLLPEDAYSWAMRGSARLDVSRHSEAIDDLTESLRLNPADPVTLAVRGMAYRERGEPLAARNDLEAAVDLLHPTSEGPSDAESLHTLAMAYLELGQLDEAISDLTRALATKPRMWESMLMRSYAYSRAGKFAEALADAEQGGAINPRSAYAAYVHGLALAGLGRLDEAVAAYDRSLALNGRSALVLVGRSEARRRLGRNDEALSDAKAALALNDRLPEAFAARAEVLAALGRLDESEADRQTSTALSK